MDVLVKLETWHTSSLLFTFWSRGFLLKKKKKSFPQAMMYVLCFRMRSILEIPRLKSQLLLMPIGSILTHRLSPLKVNWLTPWSLLVFIFCYKFVCLLLLSLKSTLEGVNMFCNPIYMESGCLKHQIYNFITFHFMWENNNHPHGHLTYALSYKYLEVHILALEIDAFLL